MTPLPPIALASLAGGQRRSLPLALARIATASGWLEPVSSAARQRQHLALRIAAEADDVGHLGLALGQRAGLVERHGVIWPSLSSTAPPLSSSPRRAPAERPAAIAAGVEMTSAQGQPISRMARPL